MTIQFVESSTCFDLSLTSYNGVELVKLVDCPVLMLLHATVNFFGKMVLLLVLNFGYFRLINVGFHIFS